MPKWAMILLSVCLGVRGAWYLREARRARRQAWGELSKRGNP